MVNRVVWIRALVSLVAVAISLASALGQDERSPARDSSLASGPGPDAATTRAPLAVGDPAPPLHVREWVRGAATTAFPPGSITVVVFWASWCDASVSAIPALNSVQREFADRGLRVMALSSRDAEGESLSRVRALTASSLPPIEFSVAFDDRRRSAHAWLDAAEQEYVPTAFITGRDGTIAWIGSPLWPPGEFQEAVAAVVADELDAPRREAHRARWSTFVTRMQTLEGDAQRAVTGGRIDEACRLFDQLIALSERTAPRYAMGKFSLLLSPGREERAYEYARTAIAGPLHESPTLLNELAWAILDDPGLEARDFKLALTAGRRAEELTQGRDAAILDTIARAYQCSGDLAQAVAFQSRAVEVAGTSSERDEYAEKLAEYKQARDRDRR